MPASIFTAVSLTAATSTYMSYCKGLWTLFYKKETRCGRKEKRLRKLFLYRLSLRGGMLYGCREAFFETSMTNYSSPLAETTCGYMACGAVTRTYFYMKHARGIMSSNVLFHNEPLICLKYCIIIYKLSSKPLIRIDRVLNRLNWPNLQLF